MIKIDIMSGFLGTGKTTLIKKLITQKTRGERVVVLINEFGAEEIDEAFINDTGISLSQMTAGCICCGSSGDFLGQLQSIIGWRSPDRIIIEPSGVAMLSDLLRVIQELSVLCPRDKIQVNALITMVDAKRCQLCIRNYEAFYIDQIRAARVLVLRRTEEINEEKLSSCVELLQAHNPHAVIITERETLDVTDLLEKAGELRRLRMDRI